MTIKAYNLSAMTYDEMAPGIGMYGIDAVVTDNDGVIYRGPMYVDGDTRLSCGRIELTVEELFDFIYNHKVTVMPCKNQDEYLRFLGEGRSKEHGID